jgi:hypothetical protein
MIYYSKSMLHKYNRDRSAERLKKCSQVFTFVRRPLARPQVRLE